MVGELTMVKKARSLHKSLCIVEILECLLVNHPMDLHMPTPLTPHFQPCHTFPEY